MAYSTAEARQDLLAALVQAADELGLASACLAEAYEQLDEYNADRLEADCFRPVQLAYGRAKRAHAEFAGRHGLAPASFETPATGLASQGVSGFVARAVDAVREADHTLAELQDSMLPVEVGDEELRAALKGIREPLAAVPPKAREFLRGVGR